MKTKPFASTVKGPIEKTSTGWGWYDYPPIGSEIWRGDFTTRAAARLARKNHDLSGTASAAEQAFQTA